MGSRRELRQELLKSSCRSWRKPQLAWSGCRDDHNSSTDCASAGRVPVAGNRRPVRLLPCRSDAAAALCRQADTGVHRQQRCALSRYRTHHAGDAGRARHPGRTGAATDHHGHRLRELHSGLPRPRHRLCPRHSPGRRRQGWHLCRRSLWPQGQVAGRIIRRGTWALPCRSLKTVRRRTPRRDR